MSSVLMTLTHSPNIPVPKRYPSSSNSSSSVVEDSEAGPSNADVFPDETFTELHLISKTELNDLLEDLDLTKE